MPIDNGNVVRSSAPGSTDSTGAMTSQGSTIPLPSTSEPGCPAVSAAHVSGPISPSTCRPSSAWKVLTACLVRRSEVAVGNKRHLDGNSQLLLRPEHCWTLVTQWEWIPIIEPVVGALRRQWRCRHGGRRRFGRCVVRRGVAPATGSVVDGAGAVGGSAAARGVTAGSWSLVCGSPAPRSAARGFPPRRPSDQTMPVRWSCRGSHRPSTCGRHACASGSLRFLRICGVAQTRRELPAGRPSGSLTMKLSTAYDQHNPMASIPKQRDLQDHGHRRHGDEYDQPDRPVSPTSLDADRVRGLRCRAGTESPEPARSFQVVVSFSLRLLVLAVSYSLRWDPAWTRPIHQRAVDAGGTAESCSSAWRRSSSWGWASYLRWRQPKRRHPLPPHHRQRRYRLQRRPSNRPAWAPTRRWTSWPRPASTARCKPATTCTAGSTGRLGVRQHTAIPAPGDRPLGHRAASASKPSSTVRGWASRSGRRRRWRHRRRHRSDADTDVATGHGGDPRHLQGAGDRPLHRGVRRQRSAERTGHCSPLERQQTG